MRTPSSGQEVSWKSALGKGVTANEAVRGLRGELLCMRAGFTSAA